METMEILKLVIVLIVGFFILKFTWGSVKGIIKLVVGIIIIAVGVYLMKPEMLYDVFGKDKVESVAKESKRNIKKVGDAVTDTANDAIDSVKEKTKDISN